MRFAAPFWLFGTTLSLVIAAVLAAGGFLLLRAVKRFGDEKLVLALVTGRPGGRRALKGGLLVTAVALAFLALSEPQYGRGTRLIGHGERDQRHRSQRDDDRDVGQSPPHRFEYHFVSLEFRPKTLGSRYDKFVTAVERILPIAAVWRASWLGWNVPVNGAFTLN